MLGDHHASQAAANRKKRELALGSPSKSPARSPSKSPAERDGLQLAAQVYAVASAAGYFEARPRTAASRAASRRSQRGSPGKPPPPVVDEGVPAAVLANLVQAFATSEAEAARLHDGARRALREVARKNRPLVVPRAPAPRGRAGAGAERTSFDSRNEAERELERALAKNARRAGLLDHALISRDDFVAAMARAAPPPRGADGAGGPTARPTLAEELAIAVRGCREGLHPSHSGAK